jgi:hypothetical protein
VGTTLGDLLEINPNTAAVRSSRRLAADWLTAVVLAPDGSVIAGAADGKLYPSDPLVK